MNTVNVNVNDAIATFVATLTTQRESLKAELDALHQQRADVVKQMDAAIAKDAVRKRQK